MNRLMLLQTMARRITGLSLVHVAYSLVNTVSKIFEKGQILFAKLTIPHYRQNEYANKPNEEILKTKRSWKRVLKIG